MISFIESGTWADYVIFIGFFATIQIIVLLLQLKYPSFKKAHIPILASLVVSIMGLSIGILSGNSLTPVMSAVIPAVLTFLSGFAVYLVTQKKGIELAVPLSVIFFFSIALTVGTWTGSDNRVLHENDLKEWEQLMANRQIELDLYKYEQMKIIDSHYSSD